jgi:hypothetical protein
MSPIDVTGPVGLGGRAVGESVTDRIPAPNERISRAAIEHQELSRR